MNNDTYQKDTGPVDSFRERTSIYGLGFNRASFEGFILPSIIVIAFGIIPAILIYKFL